MTDGFSFSLPLVQEYQTEMATTYGVAITAEDAQIQLHSLARCLFGSTAAGAGFKPRRAAPAPKVGDSITPTSVHLDK